MRILFVTVVPATVRRARPGRDRARPRAAGRGQRRRGALAGALRGASPRRRSVRGARSRVSSRRFRRFDRVRGRPTSSWRRGAAARLALRAAAARSRRGPRRPRAPRVAVEPGAVWSDDRDAAMAEIRARAARRPVAGAGVGVGRRSRPRGCDASHRSSCRIRRRRDRVRVPCKRIVRRLTRWQVDPIVARVNQLRGDPHRRVRDAGATR